VMALRSTSFYLLELCIGQKKRANSDERPLRSGIRESQ
jgi:hypothetical protein